MLSSFSIREILVNDHLTFFLLPLFVHCIRVQLAFASIKLPTVYNQSYLEDNTCLIPILLVILIIAPCGQPSSKHTASILSPPSLEVHTKAKIALISLEIGIVVNKLLANDY